MSARAPLARPSSRTLASSCSSALSRPAGRAIELDSAAARADLAPSPSLPLGFVAPSAEKAYDTTTYRDTQDHRVFEQSATGIWAAICQASNDVIRAAGVDPKDVKGVGFDATCSLVVTDLDGRPVEVTKGKDLGLAKEWTEADVGKDHSVILWAGACRARLRRQLRPPPADPFSHAPLADHRAEEEAKLINATGSVVLDYVGGTMSVSRLVPLVACCVRRALLLRGRGS